MPGQIYHIPDLLALVPKPPTGYLNPHLKQADGDFIVWVNKVFKFSPAFAEEIYKSQIPYLMAAMSPHASYEELRISTDLVLSTLILEVLTDERSSAVSGAICEAWMNIMRGKEKTRGFDHPLLKVVRKEIFPSVKKAMDSFFWPQLFTTLEEYASNVLKESLDREAYSKGTQLKVRDIPAYLEMRCGAAAIRACFTITRAFQKIYVPDEVLAHPLVRGLENASADMSVLTNDIYSFKKEYEGEDSINNLFVLMQHDPQTAHLSLQERIDFAAKLWAEAYDRFEACRCQLPSFGPEVDKHVSAYADSLLENAVGEVEWSRVVPRYHTFESDTDRQNNILRLQAAKSKPRRVAQPSTISLGLFVTGILAVSIGCLFVRHRSS